MEHGGNLNARVQNLETRFERVEQILPNLATKDDLKRFATRKDLESEMHSMREHVREVKLVRTEFAERVELILAEGRAERRAAREDTLALIEAERERWRAVIDQQNRLFDRIGTLDVDSNDRDRAPDPRVTRLEGHEQSRA